MNHRFLARAGRAALAAVFVIGGVASANAQLLGDRNGAYPYRSPTPRIDERAAQQHRRIEQGVRSGELTEREAWRLQQQQRTIRQMERRARADGMITPYERREIRAAQRHADRSIQRNRHDRQHY